MAEFPAPAEGIVLTRFFAAAVRARGRASLDQLSPAHPIDNGRRSRDGGRPNR